MPPVEIVEGKDEPVPAAAAKPVIGIIYPPPEVRSILFSFVKADRPVPDGEMFTLSVRRSFMRRRASFPVPIRYACQFIGMVQNAERSGCADQFLLVETVTWPIVFVPDSICSSIQFVLPIHYH